jgi:small-conductance mechanosensitive channel
MGEVERIGLKTTRLRSLGGEQIIISNSDLLAARIRNYKRMHERRVMFQLSLPLTTKGEEMKKAVSLIQAIVASKPRIRPERCHFMSIGKVSMDIEVVYYVLTEDHKTHMDLQQDILLDIQRAFEMEKLSFARPVQTVTVEPQEFIMRTDLNNRPDNEKRESVS